MHINEESNDDPEQDQRVSGENESDVIIPEVVPDEIATSDPGSIKSVSFTKSIHIGPLPSPEDLKKYGEVVPDLPAIIIGWTTSEIEARRKTEQRSLDLMEKDLDANIWVKKATTTWAGIIASACVILAGISMFLGSTAGAVLSGLGAFLYGIALVVRSFRGGPNQPESAKQPEETEKDSQ